MRTDITYSTTKQKRMQVSKPLSTNDLRFSYTSEELFISFAINLLLSDSLFTRHKVALYLKNLPPDFFQDSQLRAIHKILLEVIGRANGELADKDALYHKIIAKVAEASVEKKKLSVSYFTNLYALAPLTDMLISLPTLHSLATELLNQWKQRKKESIKQFLIAAKDLPDDKLQLLIQELVEIERFSPFPEEQEVFEEESLLAQAAKPEDFDIECEYLYEDFLPSGTINFWVAPPSQGKSALALAISCYLLDKGKVEKVLYFDGDNPISVLNKRKVKEIVGKYKDRLFYFNRIESAQDFQKLVQKTHNVKGKVLIVIDTLRAFVGAQDINKGEVAEKIMAFFREITRNGEKTVIILHHVNKPPREGSSFTLMDRIKGATEFRDRADVVYFVTKKNQDDKSIYLTLENVKPRIPVKYKLYFQVLVEEARLTQLEEIYTREEEEFIKAVVKTIYEFSGMRGRFPNKYQLEEALKEKGFGRNQSRAWLDKFDGKFWKQSYDGLYNQITFKLTSQGESLLNALKKGQVTSMANWRTGELRNNADSEELTEEQRKVIESWGSFSEKSKVANWQTGELRNNATSPVRHPEKLEKPPETTMNSKFASSPPNENNITELSKEKLIELARKNPQLVAHSFWGMEDKAPPEVQRIISFYYKKRKAEIKEALKVDEEDNPLKEDI